VARFYANENFPRPVVEELRRLGHDVLTIQETGKGGEALTDHGVVTFATAERRAVLTINRLHFIRLHQYREDHAGIVVCTADTDFAGQARRIHDAVSGHADLAGRLLRVNRPA